MLWRRRWSDYGDSPTSSPLYGLPTWSIWLSLEIISVVSFVRGSWRGSGVGSSLLADHPPSENRTLVEVCRKVPQAIVCLSSALRFHELTTESPFAVWIVLKPGAWSPRMEYPPVRVVRFSGAALTFGMVEHYVEGTEIKVYSPAKTIADCFKFRSKIGTELALQALRECFREKKATMDELWEAAKVCRVANVMRPYMESLS